MGKFLLVYLIKLESPEIDPDQVVQSIRGNLPDGFQMQDKTEVKPLFFGIKGINAQFILPEEEGIQDRLEDFLRGIEGVAEVEVEYMTRL